jgi:hypothetical protein
MLKADAVFQITATEMLKAAASQNPRYIIWLLARRFPSSPLALATSSRELMGTRSAR